MADVPVTEALYEGKTFRMAGRTFILPGLSMRSLKEFQKDGTLKLVNEIAALPNEEQADACVRVIHAALVRNHPGVSANEVGEWVDTRLVIAMLQCIFASSGMERVPAGEGVSP